ncbi:MAG: hypothetical protein KF777_21205 [Planctomycetaceae bacterium]|nr:hypothetical protein [Planctomycetaceae bacterium]
MTDSINAWEIPGLSSTPGNTLISSMIDFPFFSGLSGPRPFGLTAGRESTSFFERDEQFYLPSIFRSENYSIRAADFRPAESTLGMDRDASAMTIGKWLAVRGLTLLSAEGSPSRGIAIPSEKPAFFHLATERSRRYGTSSLFPISHLASYPDDSMYEGIPDPDIAWNIAPVSGIPPLASLTTAALGEDRALPPVVGFTPLPLALPENRQSGAPMSLITVNNRLRLFGGLQSQTAFDQTSFLTNWMNSSLADVNLVAPRVGVLFEFAPGGLTGYYGLSQPQLGFDSIWPVNTSPFGMTPVDVHQFGLMTALADGRWFISIGGFYVTNDFAGTANINPMEDLLDSTTGGGLQLRISGAISRRWSADLGISGLERQSGSQESMRIPKSSARSTATLWTRYNIIQDGRHRLGAGLGMKVVDSYRSAYKESLLFPGYTGCDTGLFYERGRWFSARLIVENVLDRRYYNDTSTLLSDPGSPFSIKTQLQFRY